jgi:excisionase family DNA binding protein
MESRFAENLVDRDEAASEEWFTLPQIAEVLGVNPSTVRYWVTVGRLSAEKRGRRWVVKRDDVETITAQRRRRAGRPLPTEPLPEPGEQRKGLSMLDSIDFSSDS